MEYAQWASAMTVTTWLFAPPVRRYRCKRCTQWHVVSVECPYQHYAYCPDCGKDRLVDEHGKCPCGNSSTVPVARIA